MILHWFKTGWRSLIANPLFTLITIASLSIGTCGALLAAANIRQHLSFDTHVPAAERIFTVTRLFDFEAMGQGIRIEGNAARFPMMGAPPPLKDAIEGLPDLESQVRMFRYQTLLPADPTLPQGPPQPGEPPRTPPPGSVYVDPDFFEFFGLEAVDGSTDISEPNTIVITESARRRLFDAGAPAVGQTVEGGQKRMFRIVGVIKDLPPTTHLRFEALASVRTLEAIQAAERAEQERQQQAQGGGSGAMFMVPTDGWNGITGAYYLRAAAGVEPDLFASSAKRAIQEAADKAADQGSQGTQGPNGQIMRISMPRYKYNVVPLLDIHMGGRELTGLASTGDRTMLVTLGAAAIALLGVSAFNFVTLSLARSLRRRNEVAVRKVLGADQSALVRHYLTESAIVTAISLVAGFVLAHLLHPWFARTIGQPEALFDLFDPAFLVTTLVAFAVLAIVVGAYPAFYLASTRPSTALGEGGKSAPGRVSQIVTGGLMGLQISAATALLIISMTMGSQANYIETRPLGFTVKDRYQVFANCGITPQMTQIDLTSALRTCENGTRRVLANAAGISNVSYFQGALVSETISLQPFGRSAAGEKIGEAARLSVDMTFLESMGSTLLAGRFFDPNSAFDKAFTDFTAAQQARNQQMMVMMQSGGDRMMTGSFGPGMMASLGPQPAAPGRVPVIVTRAFLPLLGVITPEEAIGQQFSSQPRAQFPFEIVGVVEDWNQRPLKYAVHPIVFVPQTANNAVIEIPEDELETVQSQLNSSWKQIVGDRPNAFVSLNPLEQTLQRTYLADYQLMRAVTSFALVAIVVAGMGVFGIASFEMRRRVLEIGIRKALGASPFAVAGLVIWRAVAFAAIAALIAWPIGFFIANEWLNGFVYRTNLGYGVPPLASVVVVAFVALAVSFSAVRAAAIRPGIAIRV